MNKKYLWIWTAWIGLASGLFAYFYSLLPVSQLNIMFMAFIALPIFFGVGAPVKLFPNFFFSALSGVLWGLFYLFLIGKMVAAGVSPPAALLIIVAICTFLCVGLHMIVLGNTWFGTVPMIFGGLASTFASGGQNPVAVFGTLVGGMILGMAISEGGKVIQKALSSGQRGAQS